MENVVKEVVSTIGKDKDEVARYFDTWTARHSELADDAKHLVRIASEERSSGERT